VAADWIRAEVVDGLKRLVALSLPGQPPAETIALTAAAWVEALEAAPIAWDEELDTPRLRVAFKLLMRECDRWPQPVHLLRALPPRPQRKKLPPPAMSEEQKETARSILRELAQKLKSR
jgi:hypothetical protein